MTEQLIIKRLADNNMIETECSVKNDIKDNRNGALSMERKLNENEADIRCDINCIDANLPVRRLRKILLG